LIINELSFFTSEFLDEEVRKRAKDEGIEIKRTYYPVEGVREREGEIKIIKTRLNTDAELLINYFELAYNNLPRLTYFLKDSRPTTPYTIG
jgi:hypothetical protein